MIDPRSYLTEETAKGGLPVTIRALRPDDRERMATAVRGLDAESIYLRLFSRGRELTEAAIDRIMRFDPEREIVLVATTGNDTRVIGSGRYIVTHAGTAEVAFMVEEEFRGRGIASQLLRHLANVASAQGIETFEADVLAQNRSMQAVFARTGWSLQSRREGDVVHLTMALARDR